MIKEYKIKGSQETLVVVIPKQYTEMKLLTEKFWNSVEPRQTEEMS